MSLWLTKKANELKPSPEIEALVSKMNLTDKGKTILYASSPQLKGKLAFNGTCSRGAFRYQKLHKPEHPGA